MVCQSCKEKKHEECRGYTWCDCQHRTLDEVLAAADQLATDPSLGVRRGRPVRKEEPEDDYEALKVATEGGAVDWGHGEPPREG